uniref:mRNA-decapping enzyme C-terminal domain-containing protein n=1 Tax=Corethron hystrix TaxID=216773 RepID=A0A7S1BY92_9STRA|mmetsp:Transcript_43284/g.101489  ORF Transcript_43284/g.101489 Transcript_43284/m.101489 type:complete len:351 (+) Transcript_43284:443-1495(+)
MGMDDIKHSANLRALQRVDPSTVDIVSSATHVVLYQFNDTHQQWEKAGIDGSLFLTKRNCDEINPTRFRLVVLNRSNPENLIVDVSGSFQMQVRQPYLIFRDSKNPEAAIRGIWFHDDEERSGVASLLQKVIKLQSGGSNSTGSNGSSSISGNCIDTAVNENKKSNSATSSSQLPSQEISRGQNAQNSHTQRSQQDTTGGASYGQAAASTSSTPANTPASTPRKVPDVSNEAGLNSRSRSEATAALLSTLQIDPSSNVSQLPTSQPPSTSSNNVRKATQDMVLDKKSLQLSLLSLIRDDRFLDLIHAQYLKVATARANQQQQQPQQQQPQQSQQPPSQQHHLDNTTYVYH